MTSLPDWSKLATYGPLFAPATTTYSVNVSCPDPIPCERSTDMTVVVANPGVPAALLPGELALPIRLYFCGPLVEIERGNGGET